MPLAEPIQHHRRRQKHRRGIGFVLTRDIGCTSVGRLEHAMRHPEVTRGRIAHAAYQRCAEIGNDVTEHVLCYQHIKLPGPHHH